MGLINISPFGDVLQSHAFSACPAIRTGPMDCINLSRMHWVIWRCIKFVLLLVVIIDYFKKLAHGLFFLLTLRIRLNIIYRFGVVLAY